MLLKIGGNEYEIQVTIGRFRKLQKKYPTTTKDDKKVIVDKKGNEADNYEYSMYVIWLYLKRRWYGLKPFVFRRFMVNSITFKEYSDADKIIAKEYKLEDKEGGN